MNEFSKKLKMWFVLHNKSFATLLFALLNATLIYYCLELGNKNPLMNGFFYTGLNILTIFVIISAVFFFVQRWWISSLIVSTPCLILSIANYYTLLYRNSPISTQDLHNFGTTLSVIDSYKFPVSVYVIAVIVFFVLSLLVSMHLRTLEKGKKSTFKKVLVKNTCLVLFGIIFIHSVYLAKDPIKPRTTFVWSWEKSYHTYGYAASSIEVFQNSLNMVAKPEGYSEDILESKVLSKISLPVHNNTPDIIMILNETFYDLRDLVDMSGEPSAMPFIDSLPDGLKGKTVVAGTGGGTNKSEYEFLTGNSIQLMPGITPFNYLDFDNANSMVSYLKTLGYSTWAAHCAEPLNYSRGIVYPQLGFDEVMFIEDFSDIQKYGKRSYATDKYCYDKMLESYESMGDGPRFMYMLTIQNHGGWELNEEDLDLINTKKDFGVYTDDISEFQSCISLSDQAFHELTQYFSQSDRPVIVCMVGDHAPSFATELIDKIDMDKTFALRSTPYIMWANFDMVTDFPDTVSMPFMIPNILSAAKMPMSPYYSFMAKLQTETPVLTAFNLYKTSDGSIHNYTDQTPYKENIDIYFDMVYNNVSEDANRIDQLFMPCLK